MTKLKKPVTRTAKIDLDRVEVAVSLVPSDSATAGPFIVFREKRRRKEYRISLTTVFYRAVELEAAKSKAEKKSKRRSR